MDAAAPLHAAVGAPERRREAGARAEDPVPAAPAAAPLAPAFVELYRAHFRWVWRVLARLGIPERDLPDLTHDVFVVVHRKLADYDAKRPLKPWLYGICFRVALDRKRKMSSWREALQDEVVAQDATPPADELAAGRQAHALLMRALAALDLDKRAVFVLHELEGLSMPEVAGVVDAPLNTLYSRLRLARAELTASLAKLRGSP